MVVVVVYGSYSWTGRKKNPPEEEAVVEVHAVIESTQILHGDSRGREHRQNTKHETPLSFSFFEIFVLQGSILVLNTAAAAAVISRLCLSITHTHSFTNI